MNPNCKIRKVRDGRGDNTRTKQAKKKTIDRKRARGFKNARRNNDEGAIRYGV